jgi:hypothetical protein
MTKPNIEKSFPIYFSLHYQTSENNSLSRNSLLKKNYFPANKQGISDI